VSRWFSGIPFLEGREEVKTQKNSRNFEVFFPKPPKTATRPKILHKYLYEDRLFDSFHLM
jgi:hypothetical protein